MGIGGSAPWPRGTFGTGGGDGPWAGGLGGGLTEEEDEIWVDLGLAGAAGTGTFGATGAGVTTFGFGVA